MGITMPNNPADMRSLNDPKEIRNYFMTCAKEAVEFVVCFIEDNDTVTRSKRNFS